MTFVALGDALALSACAADQTTTTSGDCMRWTYCLLNPIPRKNQTNELLENWFCLVRDISGSTTHPSASLQTI